MSSSTNKKNENQNLIKNASIVGIGTLLSRIAGLVRDLVTAYFFGAGPVADAFFVAFRIPNLLRRLLAEGALTPAFVTVFTERLENADRKASASFFQSTFTLMAMVLSVLTVLGIILAPWIVKLIAPGFTGDPVNFELTVTLTRILFPYILLISLTALAMGALNSLGKFNIPALGPVFLNLSIIFGAVLISPLLEKPVYGLAFGALLGGFMQLAIQLPFIHRSGIKLRPRFIFKDPAIKRVFLLMGPTALGGAAYQISIFINTQLASTLAVGSVSFLYYADRLMQFPLGVLTLALATAALPALSRMVNKGDMENFQKTFRSTLSLQFFITIPAMTGLIVMAQPLVELLFERGEFNSFSSLQTARALWAYSLGLPFLSGASLIARAFFSLSDTKTPAKISAISLFLGLIMAVGLIFPLKHVGLALASSLTSLINFLWLLKLLKGHNFSSFKPLFKETASYCLWALIMGLLLWPLYNSSYFSEINKLFRIIFGLFFGPLVFFGLALLFKCPHVNMLKQMMGRFKRKI